MGLFPYGLEWGLKKTILTMKPFNDEKNVSGNVEEYIGMMSEVVNIDVDKGVIEKVRSGETTHIIIEIHDNNKLVLLENEKGHLILTAEEEPGTYHSCYLYNEGEFPYLLQESVQYLNLKGGEEECCVKIVDVNIEAGMRFRLVNQGKSYVEDPNGDCCIWELSYEVVPVLADPKMYLMRWNPSISSLTQEGYEELYNNKETGTLHLNWSVYEWEEARRGDLFCMMRTGDDKAGIVFNGFITSNPYVQDDWAGTSKRRLYVNLACLNARELGAEPIIPLEKLSKEIPSIDWAQGHSGVLLPQDVARRLFELLAEAIMSAS